MYQLLSLLVVWMVLQSVVSYWMDFVEILKDRVVWLKTFCWRSLSEDKCKKSRLEKFYYSKFIAQFIWGLCKEDWSYWIKSIQCIKEHNEFVKYKSQLYPSFKCTLYLMQRPIKSCFKIRYSVITFKKTFESWFSINWDKWLPVMTRVQFKDCEDQWLVL